MKANIGVFMKRTVLTRTPPSVLQFVKKHYYTNHLSRCPKEPGMDVIASLVSPGDTVIDVGANIGLYTVFLSSLVGRQGKVFSLEPVPRTFEILSFAVRKLKMDNVSVINSAAGDATGKAFMEIPGYEWGGSNFYRARIMQGEQGKRGIEVDVRTIDSLFSDVSSVSFIKCDTEGHEVKCVRGAAGLIASKKPALFVEVNDGFGSGSRGEALCDLLAPGGYRPFVLREGRLRPVTFDGYGSDYFFLQGEHLDTCRRFTEEEDVR